MSGRDGAWLEIQELPPVWGWVGEGGSGQKLLPGKRHLKAPKGLSDRDPLV